MANSQITSPADHARAIFAAFDAQDVTAFAAFMTDDVRLRVGNADVMEGKSAFIEAVHAFLGSVAGYRHEILNVWRDDDALIVQMDVHYKRLDGQVVTLPCVNVLRLSDGAVADYRTYYDPTPVYA
jgi:ketosteroid isomerase-like protein